MGNLTANAGKGLIFAGGRMFSPDFEIGWFKWFKDMLTGIHLFNHQTTGVPLHSPVNLNP